MWNTDHKEGWALKNRSFWTVVLEKTLQGPLDCKEIQPVHPKGDQSWMFIGRTDAGSWSSNTLATWGKELTQWKRLRARGEEGGRGCDGGMVSPTQWTWVWVNFRRWWRTGKPGTLQSMGSQRVECELETAQKWKILQQEDWGEGEAGPTTPTPLPSTLTARWVCNFLLHS